MKRLILIFILFICFQYSFSEKTKSEIAYFPNERIDFSLKYGIFKIGEAQFEFNSDPKVAGGFIHADAKSSRLMKLFKNIHFRYECCIDTLTGLPISDKRILIEGDYVDESTVYYDHKSRKDSSLVYSKKTGTLAVPKNVYDLLSGFYHYRVSYLGDNLPLNHTVTTKTFFIDKVWDLIIRYCGKELINTKYGHVECLKVKPVTVVGHFFQTSDAMTIWFANSGKYLPVKFSIDLNLGTLNGEITSYKSNNPIIKSKL